MKKHSPLMIIFSIFVTLTVISSNVVEAAEIWSQTYGGPGDEHAEAVVQANDGGYAILGHTTSFGAGEKDCWLIKTDAFGNMEWNKTYGGTEWDFGQSLIQTSDGGYVIVGSTASFGAGNDDCWLIKTNSEGNTEWNKTYGGTEMDFGQSLIQTSDGGYVIAGATGSFVARGYDVWLIKVDEFGNMEWNKTYGRTDGWNHARSMVQTNDGGYILAGYTNSSTVGEKDFWVIKTDEFGNMEWNKTYGGIENDAAYSVVQASNGGYAIAGYTGSFGAGGRDCWLIKTDALGNIEWNQTYGGTEQDTFVGSLVQASDGGYVLGAYTTSFGTANNITSFGLIGPDFWLIKTDTLGNIEWNQTYGGTESDFAHSMIQTSDGEYVIAGATASSGAEGYDLLVVKTDDDVGLVPEFPSWIIPPLFVIATFSAILLKKRLRHQRT